MSIQDPNTTWNGGSGNWSDSAKWSNGVPNSTTNAFIDGGKAIASSVNLNIAGAQVGNLTIDSGDSLALPNGTSLTVYGATIGNAGTISINSTGFGAYLNISGAVTLKGPGSLTMSSNATNYIMGYGQPSGASLTNQSTIQGAGEIGWNGGLGSGNSVTNQGTINANVSAPLTIGVSSGSFANTGTLEATNGGTLVLSGGTITNTGGTIQALGSSTVQLANGVIVTGGTLTTSGTGTIQANCCSNGSTLNGVTNKGTLIAGDFNPTFLSGTINNTGTIELGQTSTGSARLLLGGNVTLSGSGTLTIFNAPSAVNVIDGNTGHEILTNYNTIQGAGIIGSDPGVGYTGVGLGLVNNGKILASQSNPLVIEPNALGFNNKGTLQVNSGDLMHVSSAVGGSFTNFVGGTLTGGTYNVTGSLQIDQLGSAGGEIVTNAANIILNTPGSRVIDAAGKNALTNLNTNATGSSFTVTGGRNFSTIGNFTNNGTLTIGAANSKFDVIGNLTNFSGTTLTGGIYNLSGTLQFKGANIVTNAANITLSGLSSKITNQGGTVSALANFATNSSSGSFTLSGNQSLTTAGNFTNAGTLTVATGSTFALNRGGSFTQSGGTTTVDGTLKSSVTAALNLNGGSLFGTGTLGFGVVDSSIITPGNSKTSSGMLAVSGSYQQKSTGALSIAIGGTTAGTKYDQLNVSGAATVNGILNLSLSNGFVPTIGTTFDILNAKSISGTFSTVNGTHINASEHFVVACDTTDCDVTVARGAAISSAGTAGVQQALVPTARAQFHSVVLAMPRNVDVAGFAGGFHRDQLSVFRMPHLSPFADQIAARRSAPSASVSSLLLARKERRSGFGLKAASPEVFRTSRSSTSSMAPHLPSVFSVNHGGADHKGLEMGLDLLSFLGNPRHFTRSVFSQTGPANATGLTFLSFNGYR